MAYGWDLLNRKIFLMIWIILALAMGFMLGLKNSLLKQGIAKSEKNGDEKIAEKIRQSELPQIISALAYMIPGLWGAPYNW